VPVAASQLSVVLLVVGAVVAALVLLVALLALLRRLGIAEDRLAPVGHAMREAGWRLSGTWQDFVDWLRVGR
jgi:hypothetical protein